MTTNARWAEDPTGVFTHRYWDGTQWTEHVAIDGRTGTSPIDVDQATAEQIAAELRPIPPPPGAGVPPPPTGATAPASSSASMTGTSATSAKVIVGQQVSSLGRRFGAHLLDLLLSVVTLGIGWMIWALVISGEARTPGKKLMGMRCVRIDTGAPLDPATFILVRGGIGLVGGLVAYVTVIGLVVYLLPFFNEYNQHFYGMMTSSTYVDV